MAPFPESEDMTIKRLKVALRKNDLQLLKMGTYKLHEKFHTGYEFELIEDLRRILEYVEENNYPADISDILCNTIKEILSKDAIRKISKENQIVPEEGGKSDIPITLQQENFPKQILSPQNLGAIEPVQVKLETEQPAQTPKRPQNSYYEPNRANTYRELTNDHTPRQNQGYGQGQYNPQYQAQPVQQPVQQQLPQQQQIQQQPYEKPEEPDYNTVKNIAVFYDDFKNDVDFTAVKEYKNNLNFLFSKNQNGQDYNILKQISTLTHLLDTDVNEIDKIISMLTTSKGKISFITSSQSQDISRIFCEKKLDFDIPFVKKAQNKDNAFNLIPMTGSTNIFVCSSCNLRTLKTDFNTRTLSVQCPHCGSAAFPDIYAINSYNPDCNPVFWHRAFAALMKSEIWILINPPLDENKEIIFDFIKTAYEAKAPEKIYILSKENDKKEFYRQTFMGINDNCKIKMNFSTQDKFCEEFINEEVVKKVFN